MNLYREAAIRVTDNIWTLQSYFVREMQLRRDDVNTEFDIDENVLDEIN